MLMPSNKAAVTNLKIAAGGSPIGVELIGGESRRLNGDRIPDGSSGRSHLDQAQEDIEKYQDQQSDKQGGDALFRRLQSQADGQADQGQGNAQYQNALQYWLKFIFGCIGSGLRE